MMALEGKGLLYLPPYSGAWPAVVPVRCLCGLRYAVFTGAVVIGEGCGLVRAKADAAGLVFVDARVEPYKMCECGQSLDFSTVLEISTVM
jgi:hypothetical protein